MNQEQPKSNEAGTRSNDWKLYELLWEHRRHYHTKWIDNYRVFLPFNTFLLPAIADLKHYFVPESDRWCNAYVDQAMDCIFQALSHLQNPQVCYVFLIIYRKFE